MSEAKDLAKAPTGTRSGIVTRGEVSQGGHAEDTKTSAKYQDSCQETGWWDVLQASKELCKVTGPSLHKSTHK